MKISELEIGHRRVVQYAAEVRVHRNVPGRAALRGDSYRLEMPQVPDASMARCDRKRWRYEMMLDQLQRGYS